MMIIIIVILTACGLMPPAPIECTADSGQQTAGYSLVLCWGLVGVEF